MIIGDLAIYAGIVGIILYLCIIIIRHTGNTSRMAEGVRKCEERIAAAETRLRDLHAEYDEKSPHVDAIVKRVLGLREKRDRLEIEYQDLLAKSQEREIHIKSGSRGG